MRHKFVLGCHATGKLEKTAKHLTRDSSAFLSVFVETLLPTHCRCRRQFLYLIAFNNAHILGRTPLDGGSDRPVAEASRCAKHNIHRRHIHAPAGFEPTIPASERPQTYALVRAAIRIG